MNLLDKKMNLILLSLFGISLVLWGLVDLNGVPLYVGVLVCLVSAIVGFCQTAKEKKK